MKRYEFEIEETVKRFSTVWIEAENEEEAREQLQRGQWDDEDIAETSSLSLDQVDLIDVSDDFEESELSV